MTQRALADATGVPQSSIARIERGKTDPRVDTLQRLLRATGSELSTSARLGEGVDRSLIPVTLAMTPDERGRSAARAGRTLETLLDQVRPGVQDDRHDRAEFQPDELLRLLNRHRVRYVVIGGLAAILHGSPSVTRDTDICHARDAENLVRLADALREVNARLRGAPAGLPFRLDTKTLANGDSFTFTTDVGSLDILATPAGTNGYDDLVRTSESVSAFGEEFAVASLDDLIRMKRAAGRPKDRIELEILGALREEIDAQGRAR